MTEKGTCQKHGEFTLTEGCPQCLAEKRGESAPEAVKAEPLFPSILPSDQTAIIKVKPEVDVEVKSFYEEALKLEQYAIVRVIATAEDLKPATDDLSIIAGVKKAMEEKRKEYVKPLQNHVQEINDAFKTLMRPIEEADRITRVKMLDFTKEQERIRLEQEEINRKRREAAEAEMELNGELSEPVNLVEVVPAAPKRVSTDMGSTGMVDHWKWEVVDFALLPDEYKVVDGSMLTAVAKKHHDQKPVPGVRFYNEPIIAVRAR